MEEAQRLLQAACAAEWALAAYGLGGRRWGAYASEQEWRGVVNRRRDAAAPQPLFLADLLQELRDAVSVFVHLFEADAPAVDQQSISLHLL